MASNEEGEETVPRPKQVVPNDDNNYSAEYVRQCLCQDTVFPPSQHENFPLEPDVNENSNKKGSEDIAPELVAEEGGKSDIYEVGKKTSWKTKPPLSISDDMAKNLVVSLIQRTWMRQLSLLKLFYSGFAAPSLEIRSLDMLHFYIAVEELAEEHADARSLLYGATSDSLIKLWRRTCCLTIMQRLLKPSCLDLIAKMFQRLFQGVITWQSRCLMLCFLSSITAHNFLEEAPEFPIYSIAWRILFIFLFFFFKFSLVFSFIQRPFLLSNSILANTCTSCCSDPMAVQSFKLQRVSKSVLKAVSSLDLFDKGKSGAGTLSHFCYGHAVWFLMVTMLAKKVAAASYSTTLINCFKCSFFVTANCHFD